MKIQYTSYCVTVWTDSGKAYTAATEEEAREMLEEDSGKELDKTQAARALQLAPFSSFYTMVKSYNSGIFLCVLRCAD